MWRKNRNPNGGTSAVCRGVDLNRNFDYNWKGDYKLIFLESLCFLSFNHLFPGEGSSTSSCSDIYRGAAAFSEPESQAIRDFVQSRAQQLDGFITLHSYSQIWMHPYGHKLRTYPADVEILVSREIINCYYKHSLLTNGLQKNVALRATKKLEAHFGTKYTIGTGADTLCKQLYYWFDLTNSYCGSILFPFEGLIFE